ncbi:MAG: nicotinamide riboside transporter PnuC [Mariniphaga sp.]
MSIFDIDSIAFQVFGYPFSFVEIIGTFFGLISVLLATRTNILTWPTGIINEIFLFLLFYQVQLYADMFLQVYFLAVTLYGWYWWNSNSKMNRISELDTKIGFTLIGLIIFASVLTGYFISNLHLYFPQYFRIQAAYPFVDSLIMVSSVIATFLLAMKKIENWYLWIMIDFICTLLYFKKEVYILSLEYLIFLGLASYGLYYWKKELQND